MALDILSLTLSISLILSLSDWRDLWQGILPKPCHTSNTAHGAIIHPVRWKERWFPDLGHSQYAVCFHVPIKSKHFYCHITTLHVPWWVKFLRACSRQCRNNLHIDSTYLQTYTDDNVQYTHTQYTQCTIRHAYSYQYTLYTVCTHSTLCTHIYTK